MFKINVSELSDLFVPETTPTKSDPDSLCCFQYVTLKSNQVLLTLINKL